MMFSDIRKLVAKYMRPEPADAAGEEFFSRSGKAHLFQKNITIAVCNQKGGCGKTTTCINLSAFLAEKGYRVLVVDLDPQAHASLGLGVNPDNARKTVYDVLMSGEEPENTIINTEVDNLDVMPANFLLSGAQVELINVPAREYVLKAALKKLKYRMEYDFIIMDMSPTLNLVSINGMTAADFVLVPLLTHYYSLEGMRELLCTIDVVKARYNTSIDILGVLVTMFDARRKVNRDVLEEIRHYFKGLVFRTVISNNVKLYEAPAHKKPINIYAPESIGAKDYSMLADEVLTALFGEVVNGEISRGNEAALMAAGETELG